MRNLPEPDKTRLGEIRREAHQGAIVKSYSNSFEDFTIYLLSFLQIYAARSTEEVAEDVLAALNA